MMVQFMIFQLHDGVKVIQFSKNGTLYSEFQSFPGLVMQL